MDTCGFNTQPPEGGCGAVTLLTKMPDMFQHTATRRWLLVNAVFLRILGNVSTHSHPKVAANWQSYQALEQFSFNTQPPEGGCQNDRTFAAHTIGFNTQPPEGGCCKLLILRCLDNKFQHTATRRWLPRRSTD